MKKEDKEKVVSELTERLQASETLLVADYRGLTMPQIDALRSRLIESGASFTVVKNTLTRRAAEAAGADALLTLLEGPSAIAFLEADGDMVAAAKALADWRRSRRCSRSAAACSRAARCPRPRSRRSPRCRRSRCCAARCSAAIIAPITALAGLVNAPLQNLYGLIDARIEQLGGAEAAPAPAPLGRACFRGACSGGAGGRGRRGGTDRRRRRPHHGGRDSVRLRRRQRH